jgi:hypothetical protein
MQNQRAFVICLGVAMTMGTVAGAAIGIFYGNLALWIGLGPAIGLGFVIGPIAALTLRKQKDSSA